MVGLPFENKCLTKAIIYQATVTSEEGSETYIGLTDTDFKSRFRNHKQSFKKQMYSTQAELSKYVWELKQKNIQHRTTWTIIDKAHPYSPISKRCNLCRHRDKSGT